MFKILLCCLAFLAGCNPASNIPIKEFEVQARSLPSENFTIPGRLFIGNEQKSTTMIFCHGGPHSAGSNDIELLQNLAYEYGINVVSFDFRGSKISGYKQVAQQYNKNNNKYWAYLEAGDSDYGGIHMDDLKRVVSYVSKHYPSLVDPDKLIIAGHSFGGYMVALAVTDPEITKLFKLGIAVSGFFDLGVYANYNVFSLNVTPNIAQRRSPRKFVENISQPVLVIMGDEYKDFTTLVNRADTVAFVNAAKADNKKIYTLFLKGLNHSQTYSSRKTWEFAKPFIDKLKAL